MLNMSEWPDCEEDCRRYLSQKKRTPFFTKLCQDWLKKHGYKL